MVNDKMLNGFMEKKQYISPALEVVNLRAIHAMMNPFGDASNPKDPFLIAPKKNEPEVF